MTDFSLPAGADADTAQSYVTGLLVGRRVRFRAVQEADLEALVRAWEDPRVAIHQTTTWLPHQHEGTGERLRTWTRNESATKGVSFAVETLAGELVGWVALFGVVFPHRSAEMGITLSPEHMGQGYGPEVVDLVLRYGFQEMGLHRVYLNVFAYNTRGIRAYERAGFRREGVAREAIYRGGAFHDSVAMSILEDEWRARHVPTPLE